MLSHLTKKLGKFWCDVLVADGLYVTRQDFKEAKEKYGCDLLVKTSEQSLDVVQNASGLFSGNLHIPKMEVIRSIDAGRLVRYEAKALAGFGYPLKVGGKGFITHLKYVITTRKDLTAKEMREIAHHRWQIENNVFKRLNSLINSKNVHTHNLPTLNILLHLWLMGLCLLQIFYIAFRKDKEWLPLGKVRRTWKLFLELIERILLNNSS